MIFWIAGIISLVVAGAIFYWVAWMIVGDLMGAPFVPSDGNFLEEIFERTDFKPGKKFLDIGSGDGRVVRLAAKKYQLQATGIEIQPFWVTIAKIISRMLKIDNTKYMRKNFFSGRIPEADYIYFYLFPGTVERLGQKILKDCKPGTVVISRAFEVKTLVKKMTGKIENKGRRAYFYRV